jgi:hypothetical protein
LVRGIRRQKTTNGDNIGGVMQHAREKSKENRDMVENCEGSMARRRKRR